ncbi:SMR family transporter, partial [Salmonella enterica subsp. enterica serovar Virginia]|nr:SMR family transporter [Salmonella enterica subsp. enterica serovar Virginia]
MSWIILLIAGLLEVVWAVGLKYTHGFSRLTPSIKLRFRIHQSTNRRISSRIAITALDTATTARRTTINTLIIRLL